MSDISRRRFIEAGGAAGIVGLAGCLGGGDGGDGDDGDGEPTASPSPTPTPGMQSRTLQLGTLLPVSGEFGEIGQTIEDAARLAFETVDEGSDALTLDVTYGDSQSKPEGAVSGANNVANAGVPAVVGASTSANYLASAQQVFIPNDIVMCGAGPTAVSITHLEDKDLCFRTTPSDAFQSRVMAQYSSENLGLDTASVLAINDAFGQGLSDAFASAFEEMGGTVQAQVSFESGQASYTSRISNALEDDPEVFILIAKGGASSIQILKDYYADFDPELPIITSEAMKTARIPNEVGRPLENITGTTPLPTGPSLDSFTSQYQDRYDRSPGPFNTSAYDAAAVITLANAAAGENSGSAIKEEMRPVANTADGALTVTADNLVEGVEAAANGEPVDYQGASSPVEFDENGDIKAATYGIWKYAPETETGHEVVEEVTVG